ncbi:MAG TPA: 50S ribosomal protein L4 [bacterium]|nr:50S ribosomal protein L4 [bacterium]HMW37482.1 50S ribosomal protein L4 [bacterium]HMY35873.1 50S ribosomal protein L4 [bacterium]HMZ04458.1 50S ribosomal protein L4 [bacterium]HNB11022.1 50S ribosomal protein L4 [bacterium]
MKIEVKNIKGEATGRSVELPKDIFGIEPSEHAVYVAVTHELSNKRHGTHSTLEKSEVSGTTKKPWKQKGTGGARSGSVKTPLWPGGGIVFGPRPHLYKKDTNVKLKRLARKSVLSIKASENRIVVVEDFHTLCADLPKTKEVYGVLNNLQLTGEVTVDNGKRTKPFQKVLVLVDKTGLVKDEKSAKVYENFRKSCRNIPGLKVGVVNNVSTYELMNADTILFHESAIKNVNAAFGAAE